MVDGKISMAPESLSMCDMLRLVEIAHETSDTDLKKMAMCLLHMAQNPLYCVAASPHKPAWHGELYFMLGERKIAVTPSGSGYEVCERRGTLDYAARQVSQDEWHRAPGAK